MSPIKSFRRAVTNIKSILVGIPIAINEIKTHTEREILKAKAHQYLDKTIEIYGDTLVSIAKNVDVDVFASLAFDILALAEKWKEPIKEQSNNLKQAIKPILVKMEESHTIMEETIEIFNKIAKENKWNERFTSDSEKLEQVREIAEKTEYIYMPLHVENICILTKPEKVREVAFKLALEEEIETFFARKENESVNEYWLRCRKGITKYTTDVTDFIISSQPTTEKKNTKTKD